MINIGDYKYNLIENNRDCFVQDEFENLFTDYFYEFDYIIGDYAYGKLRLKGFYKDNNKKAKEMNKISSKEKYIKDNCAFQCKYFVLEKI